MQLAVLALLADQRYMHLGDKFRKTGTEIPPTVIVIAVLLLAAVVGLLWLLAVYITGRETRAHYNILARCSARSAGRIS